jgi:signal transduction histidine kinase
MREGGLGGRGNPGHPGRDRPSADVSIAVDDGLLRQLVTNLLDNAVQYTPTGGSVTVAVKSDAGFATITVSDTGPGIPPADSERVFERFVRLDPARSATSGAGLGLPIARWIAEQHDGTLTWSETREADAGSSCGCPSRRPVWHDSDGLPPITGRHVSRCVKRLLSDSASVGWAKTPSRRSV